MSLARRPAGLLAVLLLLGMVLASCGGGTAGKSPGAETSATPKLQGKTIRFANSAPPDVTDTVIYSTLQILKSWGADVALQNVQGDPTAVRAVLSGQADVASRPSVGALVNGGLVAFGVSHPRVDYFLVGAKNITSIDQLPGHKFAVSNTGGIEALMYHSVLAVHKIPESQVPMSTAGAGTASQRVQAMLAGRLDATFVHADGWIDLEAHGLHKLATVAKDVPKLAAGYFAAKPAWIKENPDLAGAIDRAWLMAAHQFQTDKKGWISMAQEYTKNQSPDAHVEEYYRIAKEANFWPDDGAGFSEEELQYNLDLAVQGKIITDNKPASLSDWANQTHWKQAMKAVLNKG